MDVPCKSCGPTASFYPRVPNSEPNPGRRSSSSPRSPSNLPFGYRFHWTDLPLVFFYARAIFAPLHALALLGFNVLHSRPISYFTPYYEDITWQLDKWFAPFTFLLVPLVWMLVVRIVVQPKATAKEGWLILAWCLWDQFYAGYRLVYRYRIGAWRSVWDLVGYFGTAGVSDAVMLLAWLGWSTGAEYVEPWLRRLEQDVKGIWEDRRRVKGYRGKGW